MKQRMRRSLGMAMTDVIAATAALTLVATVAPSGLQRMRNQVGVISCANHLRVSNQAFNVYGGQFRGTWIAPWDNNYPTVGAADGSLQWPYTMLFYVTGHPITDGKPVRSNDGWWSTEGRGGSSYAREFANSPMDGAQLQCPEIAKRGAVDNMMWYGYTSFSYAIMNRRDANGQWRYSVCHYPIPDFMTHASSTIHLHDMAALPSEMAPNAWSTHESRPLDPHDGKSNYVFVDGHVELLAVEQTNERMWQDRWTPETDAAAAAPIGGDHE